MSYATKVINSTIAVTDPIEFCSNIDKNILSELSRKFIGRCFGGSFILGITRVVTRGSCYADVKGGGYIDVEFIANTLSINGNDIITNITVSHIMQIIIGTTEFRRNATLPPARVVATIINPVHASAIALGQIISVRARITRHETTKEHVSLGGSLLICDQSAPQYKLSGVVDPIIVPAIKTILDSIRDELTLRAAFTPDQLTRMMMFEKLMYSYKLSQEPAFDTIAVLADVPEWYGPISQSNTSEINLCEILADIASEKPVDISGTWSRPLHIYRSSPLIMRTTENSEHDIQCADPSIKIIEFAKNMLDSLVVIREMVDVYNTDEIISSHVNIWNIMSSAQHDASTKVD
jgi:hypothetical protein